MRLIETLLLLADLLTLVLLAIPLPRAIRWMRYTPLIALLVAVSQLLLEGARWQMIPAYVLTAIFLLALPLQSIMPNGLAGRKRINRLAAGSAVGLGVFALAVSIALLMAFPVFRFPRPMHRFVGGGY